MRKSNVWEVRENMFNEGKYSDLLTLLGRVNEQIIAEYTGDKFLELDECKEVILKALDHQIYLMEIGVPEGEEMKTEVERVELTVPIICNMRSIYTGISGMLHHVSWLDFFDEMNEYIVPKYPFDNSLDDVHEMVCQWLENHDIDSRLRVVYSKPANLIECQRSYIFHAVKVYHSVYSIIRHIERAGDEGLLATLYEAWPFADMTIHQVADRLRDLLEIEGGNE